MDKDLAQEYIRLVRQGEIANPVKCYCDGGDTHMLYVEPLFSGDDVEFVLECYACMTRKIPGIHLVNHIKTLVEGAKNG